jgi:hypothetical protein
VFDSLIETFNPQTHDRLIFLASSIGNGHYGNDGQRVIDALWVFYDSMSQYDLSLFRFLVKCLEDLQGTEQVEYARRLITKIRS